MLVRIDDRLLHTQVVESWIKPLGIKDILIVSRLLSQDPVQPQLMKTVVPEDVEVHLEGPAGGAKWLARRNGLAGDTLVLASSPRDILELLRAGAKLEQVNVGGLHAKESAVPISSSLSLCAEDWKDLKKILESGVRLESQPIPTEKSIDLSEWIERNSHLF